ncbi:MAG TPA: Xaa-Pro peptidase family protein [Candidatus Binatia bacterium]|nr:Xaa-Pro peptidase family protein [Candidatus Binatia bacterium]
MSASIASARRKKLTAAMNGGAIDILVLFGNSWQGDYLKYATDFGLVEGNGIATIDAAGSITLYLESAVDAERAALESPDLMVVHVRDVVGVMLGHLRSAGGKRLAGAPYHLLPRGLTSQVTLADATTLVDGLLMHKTPEELDAIRRSARLADRAYEVFRDSAVAGRKQYELVADVETFLRAHGSPENFMLVGSGGIDVRGMVPPSERQLASGDLVTTELTPEVDGYYAQICRTLVVGQASGAQRKAFGVFLEALEAGIASVRPGAKASDVAKAENDVFRKYGLGEFTTNAYTRVRGHGLGLFADSKPHLLEDVDVVLEAGMSIVVHPNTYHPEAGYIVLGDTVIVTDAGAEVVTQTPRVLFESA